MKDYSEMSDFEINKAVAACLGVEVQEWNGKIFGGIDRNIDNVTSVVGVIDYCNNPSDAWPIIKSNHINIGWAGDEEWFARTVHTPKVFDTNPLRAAMIVYLMMKDKEK